ncbi:hypothetical protein G6F24_016714 [Rhizopus arrhizus]|nr:hypothetical protein G6F24_016714 [Rhizopus arrhizus]
MNRWFGRAAAALLVCAAGAPQALAAFPDRPVKLVVPYTPGGAADQLSRVLAERLSRELSQSVVVENKPGANTMIAATQVARAQPDGYTLRFPTTRRAISACCRWWPAATSASRRRRSATPARMASPSWLPVATSTSVRRRWAKAPR